MDEGKNGIFSVDLILSSFWIQNIQFLYVIYFHFVPLFQNTTDVFTFKLNYLESVKVELFFFTKLCTCIFINWYTKLFVQIACIFISWYTKLFVQIIFYEHVMCILIIHMFIKYKITTCTRQTYSNVASLNFLNLYKCNTVDELIMSFIFWKVTKFKNGIK